MDNEIRSEDEAVYQHGIGNARKNEDDLINRALFILEDRLRVHGEAMHSPDASKQYLRLKTSSLEHEVFSVLFMDNKHRVIDFQEMFRGTIDGASVWPREILKEALKVNATAVILSHNHPSGDPTPSAADKRITERVRDALELISVRVIDHIVVGAHRAVSMVDEGLI